ncbi:hypothetical protein HMPREF3196_00399 [Bifidobacterium bifidum]|uniref:Uncharacterized protein n=1 Tax=Bifidobacterium bifidum TaxID=1681 RepID=A0A133KS19_BIFBI|nr:hypothetical protein HMPREF3196_00399 [Bifidobacterium bifidum]
MSARIATIDVTYCKKSTQYQWPQSTISPIPMYPLSRAAA